MHRTEEKRAPPRVAQSVAVFGVFSLFGAQEIQYPFLCSARTVVSSALHTDNRLKKEI